MGYESRASKGLAAQEGPSSHFAIRGIGVHTKLESQLKKAALITQGLFNYRKL